MSCLNFLTNVAKGAAGAVAVGVALPIFGPVGAISATGAAVTSVVGGVLGAIDSINDDDEE